MTDAELSRQEQRVIVCGGRAYADKDTVYSVLDSLRIRPTLVIEGGANGADWLARCWAVERGVRTLHVRADWNKHGNAAGPIRNRQMLLHKPHLVVAFPGGRGTADMIRAAMDAGVPVLNVAEDQAERAAIMDVEANEPSANAPASHGDGAGSLSTSAYTGLEKAKPCGEN